MSNSTHPQLSGVTLLTDLSGAAIDLSYVVAENKDFTNLLYLGIPAFLLWFIGLAVAANFTDDDGYVVGPRRIESEFVVYRLIYSTLGYVVEGVQLIACSLGVASTKALGGGEFFRKVLGVWLLRGLGSFINVFTGVVIAQIVMIVVMTVPTVLYFTLQRDNYIRFAQYYVYGPFGTFISFIQDAYVFYMALPFFTILLTPAVCTWYQTGEAPTALDGTMLCGSSEHQGYLITGGITALLAFALGVISGTVPALVERSTDIALNGRFTAMSYTVKFAIAVIYVLFQERHPYLHVIPTLVLQCGLLFLSISLRPCLIERVNFHRSGSYLIGIIPGCAVIAATGLNDRLNPLPIAAGAVAYFGCIIMLVLKYYVFPCGKIFPAMRFMGGMYEGGIVLGLSMPHGRGIIRWEEDGKLFAGKFLFGNLHGYGVFTQFKYFFIGDHKWGRREGFGVTNMMPVDDEESYEGMWHDDAYCGAGTKRFKDGDVFEGRFVDGVEHGYGVWSFDTIVGRHTTEGHFVDGVFANVKLDDDEYYDGDLRFGVPHGQGRMEVSDDIFEGEWRAGKMHGNGIVELEAGTYDGIFREGLFSDEGNWRDEYESYTGQWRDGLKHGQGVQELESGSYEGQFVEGERHGYGIFTYNDGTVYQGSWQHNSYHGTGLLRTSDGAEYDGNWNKGRRHGTRGCITFPSGETFMGGWQDDEYHDHGALKIPDMGEYNGKFEFGKRHGLGRFTFYDGSEFVGDWAEDYAQGKGHFVFAGRRAVMALQVMSADDAEILQAEMMRSFLDYGGVYDGEFVSGAFHGTGKVTTGDGTIYEGEWLDGQPNGRGVMTHPDGSVYDGDIVNGLREGTGTMSYADKRVYRGMWENNKRHGPGTLLDSSGRQLYECGWINDVPNVEDADETSHSRGTPAGAIQPKEQQEIPHVDVDELLRAIMPKRQSSTETEEMRFRKRLELEEQHMRGALQLLLEETREFGGTIKAYLTLQERGPRRSIESEFDEGIKMIEKPMLARLLTIWTKEFEVAYDKRPKRSDMVHDEHIGPIYRYYMSIKESS